MLGIIWNWVRDRDNAAALTVILAVLSVIGGGVGFVWNKLSSISPPSAASSQQLTAPPININIENNPINQIQVSSQPNNIKQTDQEEYSKKNTVIDKKNITQQKTTNCFSYTWESAKKYCENFGTGWRLPTERELKIIFEKKEVNPNCGDLNAYWSSTLESEKSALIVVYKSASLNLHRPISNDDYSHVWCVHN